jgi:hypothetical protein
MHLPVAARIISFFLCFLMVLVRIPIFCLLDRYVTVFLGIEVGRNMKVLIFSVCWFSFDPEKKDVFDQHSVSSGMWLFLSFRLECLDVFLLGGYGYGFRGASVHDVCHSII